MGIRNKDMDKDTGMGTDTHNHNMVESIVLPLLNQLKMVHQSQSLQNRTQDDQIRSQSLVCQNQNLDDQNHQSRSLGDRNRQNQSPDGRIHHQNVQSHQNQGEFSHPLGLLWARHKFQ